jgi:peptidoglycan/xylan/chitin deacetylase (PgdA/CDA1 family)
MQATFFLLTKQTRRFPELVNEIVSGGHEVALHGEDHTRLTTLSIGEVNRRIRSSKSELQLASGRPVTLFRPPYGAQTILTYLVARRNGMQVVVWGPYAEDWVDGSPQEVANRGLAGTTSGEILLLHDGLELPDGELAPTFDRLSMFEKVLDGLSDMGLTGVSVSELRRLGGVRRTAWFRPWIWDPPISD